MRLNNRAFRDLGPDEQNADIIARLPTCLNPKYHTKPSKVTMATAKLKGTPNDVETDSPLKDKSFGTLGFSQLKDTPE